jgi:hypothetical protein
VKRFSISTRSIPASMTSAVLYFVTKLIGMRGLDCSESHIFMWSRIIKITIHKMQEFVDDRFMLLTRMSILAMCVRMKFGVLGVGIV